MTVLRRSSACQGQVAAHGRRDLKVGMLAFFVFTTIIYAAQNGVAGLSAGDFSPTLVGLFGSVPILLFAFLGFESSN